MKFWKDELFKDDRGAQIIKRSFLDTESDAVESIQYQGKGVSIINSPMGQFPVEFEVPIPADDIREAFEIFEHTMETDGPSIARKMAEEEIGRMKEQMREHVENQRSSIITPDQMGGMPPFNPNMRG